MGSGCAGNAARHVPQGLTGQVAGTAAGLRPTGSRRLVLSVASLSVPQELRPARLLHCCRDLGTLDCARTSFDAEAPVFLGQPLRAGWHRGFRDNMTTEEDDMAEQKEGFSDGDREVLRAIQDSGAIDFDRLGEVVGRVSKEAFESAAETDEGNKVIKVATNVIQVVETSAPTTGLEQMSRLQKVGRRLRRQ